MHTGGLALVLLTAAACGDDANAKKDGSVVRDDAAIDVQLIDSPPLATCTPRSGTTISLRQLPSVNNSAMLVTAPKNDGRLFVVQREGVIDILENEQLVAQPFLDIRSLDGFATGSSPGTEQGLLGLAFHPNYANNGLFYVYYTAENPATPGPGVPPYVNVLARYHVSANNYNKADPTGEILLSIPDFASNHNGGMIEFGNDNYLYVGTGDGGYGDDPCRNAQQLTRTGNCVDNPPGTGTAKEPLLGKILRIDVDSTSGSKKYGIPIDNPYADGTTGEPEIFIRGLRNPWRWSFDRMTGDLYIGDVGQDRWEELTVLAPGQQNGANLGWSRYEGTELFGNYTADPTGITMPQTVKSHTNAPGDGWISVIGGQVYRGTCFPDIVGDFYFSDYGDHPLMRGRYDMGAFSATQVGNAPSGVTSIHADARGELYLTTEGGDVYQIEAGP